MALLRAHGGKISRCCFVEMRLWERTRFCVRGMERIVSTAWMLNFSVVGFFPRFSEFSP